MLNIICPKCDSTLAIDDTSLGLMVQCGSCQNVFKAVVAPVEEEDDRPSKRKASKRSDDDDDDDDEVDERPSRRRSSRRDSDDNDDDDEDDRPRKKKSRKDDDDDVDDEIAPKNGMATGSLVLGIIALVLELLSFGGTLFGSACCFVCLVLFWPGHGVAVILAIVGLILGFLAMKKPGGKGAWMAGLILSAVTILLALVMALLYVLGFAVIAAQPVQPAPNFNPPPQQQPMRPFPQKR